MVESMRKGSVIVDLAAENGGNCAVTQPDQVATHRGVTVIGFVDLPSRLAPTASQLYGTNLCHMLADMGGGKTWNVDLEDEVVKGALVMHEGELHWPKKLEKKKEEPPPLSKRPSVRPGASGPKSTARPAIETKKGHGHANERPPRAWPLVVGAIVIVAAGQFAPSSFLEHLTVFVLACFVGWQVVWNVTPALHTRPHSKASRTPSSASSSSAAC